MQENLDSDRHNFGKAVELTTRDSGGWFRKPRPVYWEHLFFGKNSPISAFFSERSENGGKVLGKYLFNLEIEIESDWLGYSKQVRNFSNIDVGSEHFYSFGALIAYTFAFGIRDLHKSNLHLTESHLQPVDAEVVLTDLILPNETILLAFKDIEFDQCGINAMPLHNLSKNIDQLFSGYIDMFATLFQKREDILLVLESISLFAPIRVILRNTRVYKKHVNGEKPIENLLPEESIQLERGDIPYFFKKCDEEKLYWISEPANKISFVNNLVNFKPDIDRHARNPRQLLGDATVIEKKMVGGIFFLQKYFDDFQTHDFSWNGKKLHIGPDICENEFTARSFRKTSKP